MINGALQLDPVEWMKPRKFERIFIEPDRQKIWDYLNAAGWETGWKSNQRKDTYSFLHKHFAGHRTSGEEKPYNCENELRQKHELIYIAWTALRQFYLKEHELIRCYANGMCYGMDGTIHTDAREPGNYTFIYYPNGRWSPNWGGETFFYNQEETSIEACSMPKPNSAIWFDARQPHRAAGVTRQFPGTRITLMFKTFRKSGGTQQPVGVASVPLRDVPAATPPLAENGHA